MQPGPVLPELLRRRRDNCLAPVELATVGGEQRQLHGDSPFEQPGILFRGSLQQIAQPLLLTSQEQAGSGKAPAVTAAMVEYYGRSQLATSIILGCLHFLGHIAWHAFEKQLSDSTFGICSTTHCYPDL